MSTNYLCKSLEVDNFRAYKKLKIPKFKRINIIGGFNGVGKSTILETIFLVLDINNSGALAKPYSWRQVPITETGDLSFLFNDREDNARIRAQLEIGLFDVSLSKQTVPQQIISTITATIQRSMPDITSASIDQNGICLKASVDGREKIRSYMMFTANGIAGAMEKVEATTIPASIILGAMVKSTSEEIAQRLSSVIRAGRMGSLLDPLRMIQPNLESFTILQTIAGPMVYATIDGKLTPINILGDGFVTLFSVILAISNSKNGIVLLDEVDTSIHYSVTASAWEAISKAANSENCQIFATSHSKEGIINAASGICKAGREKDFQFIRIERHGEEHRSVTYDINELKAAEEFNFEFR